MHGTFKCKHTNRSSARSSSTSRAVARVWARDRDRAEVSDVWGK